jgi:hypothetical protein
MWAAAVFSVAFFGAGVATGDPNFFMPSALEAMGAFCICMGTSTKDEW